MAILLFSDAAACAASFIEASGATGSDASIVLLCAGDGTLAATPLSEALASTLPGLFVVDVNGDRFRRLNFDALHAVLLDMDPAMLLSSPGRRLVEVLAQVATLREDGTELHLAFVGASAGVVGGVLLDGLHAGLGLIPHAAIAPDVKAVADLRGLLASMSEGMGRLIALDAPVAVRYTQNDDQIHVAGKGSALLVAFVAKQALGQKDSPPPTARLHVMTGGMQSSFPA